MDIFVSDFEGILPKGPYPPCLRMTDRGLLAGYPQFVSTRNISSEQKETDATYERAQLHWRVSCQKDPISRA